MLRDEFKDAIITAAVILALACVAGVIYGIGALGGVFH